jgi:hypothetical protein
MADLRLRGVTPDFDVERIEAERVLVDDAVDAAIARDRRLHPAREVVTAIAHRQTEGDHAAFVGGWVMTRTAARRSAARRSFGVASSVSTSFGGAGCGTTGRLASCQSR